METEKIVAQIGELGAHLEETRSKLDTKADKGMLQEVEDRIVGKLVPQFQANQEARLKEVAAETTRAACENILERLDKFETETRRTGGNTPAIDAEHRAAMRDFLSNGETAEARKYIGQAGLEKRALLSGTDTKGGFLVPQLVDTEIDKLVTEIDPIASLARVVQLAGGNTYEGYKRTGIPTAGWVAESAQQAESSSSYGKGRIPTHWLSAETKASNEMLADVPGIESELIADAAEAMAYQEGYAFVLGTGVNQPTGFTVSADLTTVSGVDAAHYVSCDDFFSLLVALKAPYRATARFGFNSTVLGEVLKLKDDDGHYLWMWPQGLSNGEPAQIIGHGFDLIESMASDSAASRKCVVFADWQRWYRIVQRQGTEILRDPYTSKPDVEFNWYRRVGGDLWRAEAGRVLVTI